MSVRLWLHSLFHCETDTYLSRNNERRDCLHRGELLGDSSSLDVVEAREILLQIGVPLSFDLRLIGFRAVARIDAVHVLHAADNLAERGKMQAVQTGAISIVDEQLRGSGIRGGVCSEHDSAANVACLYGVILDRIVPSFGHSGVGGDAELRDETRNDAEETGAIVVEFALTKL
jgi:hypothetical protein